MKTDGRNLDPRLAVLGGEGAQQHASIATRPSQPPERVAGGAGYHGLPLLKKPVWKESIAIYFFVGGLAGAAAAVAAVARSDPRLRGMVRDGRRVAFGGAVLSAALLIEDLGMPRRFLYMLRVFRPTSPMSIGTWILSAFGAASTCALLPGAWGDAGGAVAGLLGLPLCGYTGVLLANTAVPLWSEGATTLPPLFIASGAVSAASLFEMQARTPAERRAARAMAIFGKLAELGTHFTYERSVRRVDEPLRGSLLWKAARAGVLASLGFSLLPRAPRAARIAGGALGLFGALCTRLAVFHAGKESARDPRATFAVQSHARGG